MPLNQLRNANFGKSKSNLTGSTGVGYTLISQVGSEIQARTTSGVYQIMSGSGIYAAFVSFPNDFHGQVLWDTGEAQTSSRAYAVEQYNYEENNPAVDEINTRVISMEISLDLVKNMTTGRWHIENNQMIFYQDDNVTEVARFNLRNSSGQPSSTSVFERRCVY